MKVGVIDIGSNTARLLVAAVEENDVRQLRRERRYLRLGDDVHALGRIGPQKLKETSEVAKSFARIARKCATDDLLRRDDERLQAPTQATVPLIVRAIEAWPVKCNVSKLTVQDLGVQL